MEKTYAILLTSILLASAVLRVPASGQSISRRFEVTPYFNFKTFSWKEFSDQGSEDLKESGLLLSFGAIPRFGFTKDLRFYGEADFQFYFGSVGYEGYIQNNFGNRTPFNTDTGYFGLELLLSGGYDFAVSGSFSIGPVGGFGIEYWSRDIGKGKVREGYIEKYTVFSTYAGAKGTYVLNRNVQLTSSLLISMPMSISESVDLSATNPGYPSDISLKPGVNPRFMFTGGGTFYSTFAEIYFVPWTLSKSGEDRGFHQPESKRVNFGIRLGYTLGIM